MASDASYVPEQLFSKGASEREFVSQLTQLIAGLALEAQRNVYLIVGSRAGEYKAVLKDKLLASDNWPFYADKFGGIHYSNNKVLNP